jgi:hypothetical protein
MAGRDAGSERQRHLDAVVMESLNDRATEAVTYVYVSRDGGRHWRRTAGLPL